MDWPCAKCIQSKLNKPSAFLDSHSEAQPEEKPTLSCPGKTMQPVKGSEDLWLWNLKQQPLTYLLERENGMMSSVPLRGGSLEEGHISGNT